MFYCPSYCSFLFFFLSPAEKEGSHSAYGRGIAFHIGEPCKDTCNDILYQIYCNTTSNRCECKQEYPVNVNNKDCVKAVKLWKSCKYSESCTFYDENAICNEDGECRCEEGFRNHIVDGGELCIHDRTSGLLENSDVITVIMVVSGVMIGTALFCLVLRLFSRARFGRNRARFGNAAAPSVVLTGIEVPLSVPHSRRPSRCSGCNEQLSRSRRASYSMLAPPMSSGSRRASSVSMRSQASVRSHVSSFHSQTLSESNRDPVRRTFSSPVDASTSKSDLKTTEDVAKSVASSPEETPRNEVQNDK
ncbi:uncharacterized protein LOC143222399 [Tachypleus tridentatus]|uniref:uncharacterized protein LOC143222399 n=1 Tax=Tachypleus tridentatus TaxID=6853 RepID=UPI003FD53675